jgi:phosphotransferase system  glucose/maltose/N-acetylglucosamine-specific IIC component
VSYRLGGGHPKDLWLWLLGFAVATVAVVTLLVVFGTIPSTRTWTLGIPGKRHVPGSGFVVLLFVGLVAVVSWVRAILAGRARRTGTDGTTATQPGVPRNSSKT